MPSFLKVTVENDFTVFGSTTHLEPSAIYCDWQTNASIVKLPVEDALLYLAFISKTSCLLKARVYTLMREKIWNIPEEKNHEGI